MSRLAIWGVAVQRKIYRLGSRPNSPSLPQSHADAKGFEVTVRDIQPFCQLTMLHRKRKIFGASACAPASD